MHSTAVLYFSGHLSIMHVREALTFVQDVARLTKADTMPPLARSPAPKKFRKLVRRLPIMHANSTDWLKHDYQPPPKKQTSLSGVSCSS